MEQKKIEKYKSMLLDARADILRELELERESFVYSDQGDIVDIAEGQVANNVLSTLSELDQEKIKDIDLALKKIEKGSGAYGVCEGTGKKIPEARLNQLPWTRYTTEYAAQLEKESRSTKI